MAKKITELQAIDTVSSDDQFVVIDKSDTSAGVLGTDKRATVAQVSAVTTDAVDTHSADTGGVHGVPVGESVVHTGDTVQTVATFNNVADMQADTTLTVGRKVRTLGYYAPGDGGGNDYEIVAAATGTADGGSFIDLSGSGTQAKGLFLANEATPFQFGAVGDGVTDDLTAVRNAVVSGMPLDWLDGEYRITDEISESLAQPIRWKSRSAVVTLDSPSPRASVFDLGVTPSHHTIAGKITFDAQDRAYSGIRLVNSSALAYPEGFGDIVADGLSVSNIYRSGTTFSGGDGILIQGGFSRVVLKNPAVKSAKLAAGAGVPGTIGIHGITVIRITGGNAARNVYLENPYVEDVFCEDVNYFDDQDGCRLFTDSDYASEPSLARVDGGLFKNCRGRSVKTQAHASAVTGCRFERIGAGFSRGYGNPEIDLQTGGGQVRDISCYYSVDRPACIVSFSDLQGSEDYQGLADGIKVALDTGTDLRRVANIYLTNSAIHHSTSFKNIRVNGSCDSYAFLLYVPTEGDYCEITNFSAESILDKLCRVVSDSSADNTCNLVLNGISNYGAPVDLYTHAEAGSLARALVSSCNTFGFNNPRDLSAENNGDDTLRVTSLAGKYGTGGKVAMYSESIANNSEYGFPAHGFQGMAFAVLSTNGGNARYGSTLLKGSFGTVDTGSGDKVSVSDAFTTAPQGTNEIYVWAEGGAGGRLFVRNESGATIRYNVMYFG